MQQRLADYVADFLVEKGISENFSVVGGGAMHLNDAFGHKDGLHTTYCHHEQACAIAAEGYERLHNRPALLTVTTGPGGTNAMTGVVGAYLDSIPMFVVSGQVRYDTTARYNMRFTDGYPLRSVGDQEYDITRSAAAMTKYAVMIEEPLTIRYHLEKAWHRMVTGRPGPVWIDIPVNFQGMRIETEELLPYDPSEDEMIDRISGDKGDDVDDKTVTEILDMISSSKRPVFYAGYGIRLAGAYETFRRVADKLGIPVVTYWDAIDLIETDHPLYVGRAGNMGDRPGNFAVQNSDCILAVGNRLSIRNTGFQWESWAREAFVIDVNIDPAELLKPTVHIDMPVHADAKEFLEKTETFLGAFSAEKPFFRNRTWIDACARWKAEYPVVLDRMKADAGGFANAYACFDTISRQIPAGTVTVTSNGTCCVAGHQSWYIGKGSRFFNNNAIASMGYGLPAAVGAAAAATGEPVVCLEGDGSIMMNLQELQTVVTNRLPVKLFLINNEGYHSIRQTQNNLFSGHTHVGIGPESGDLSFPDFRKIFEAFGWPYTAVHRNSEMAAACDFVMRTEGFAVCEIFVSKDQIFEPKSATKRLPDGKLYSPPLEDLAPFLPREELKRNMFIPMIGEETDGGNA